jgi:hypothetical protein
MGQFKRRETVTTGANAASIILARYFGGFGFSRNETPVGSSYVCYFGFPLRGLALLRNKSILRELVCRERTRLSNIPTTIPPMNILTKSQLVLVVFDNKRSSPKMLQITLHAPAKVSGAQTVL